MAAKKRSERLKPVQKLADRGEKDASVELGRSQQALSEQEARLEQLRQYRAEYRAMFDGDGQRSVDPRRLRDERAFLAKLDEVIRQQESVVEANMQAYEQQREGWIEARSRVNALDRAADRYRRVESRDQDRREQKEQDDLSQHRGRRD
ncbi:flagellar export protein FliJ [Natronospira bacteriovora]|uniref:Flagellar FliJ protein n=1 Tax=Natronospira bacteriovora TaxID=3069753 RepID=A0ABU0W4V4_9GAMM|nr:flagellar export protein FliJ [Natronospira sp. AB-CW4]MDQ2068470.1 flagellar export protein FliJ [Natronospira sp. AB-CW4]